MRVIGLIYLFAVVSNCTSGQEINFDSYKKITETNFGAFLSKFDYKELPLSTDQVISKLNLETITKKALNSTEIDNYLTKQNGSLIIGSLYNEVQEEGLPTINVIGEFFPLYKLPTNGDYVLLVFMQTELNSNKDCVGRIFTLSYDLKGNYLYLSNYTYRAGTENINAVIDEKLKSHLYYVVYEADGKMVFPPIEGDFSAKEAHLVYQINKNGKSSRISFETNDGLFFFSKEECRFRRAN